MTPVALSVRRHRANAQPWLVPRLAASWRRPLGPAELAFLGSLALYVMAGLWIRYGLDYAIGDALSRSATARAVLFSAAPRATAVGMVWMPFPALLQLPFVVLLEPFNLAELAGPLSTSFCAALTVRMMVRMADRLGLPVGLSCLYVALYAANPLVVFQAANGMSEAVFILFFVGALDGLTRWLEVPNARDQLRIALMLAASMAVRYEALLLAVVVAAFMGMRRPHWPARALTAAVVMLPTLYVFGIWLVTNRLIMGSALFWKHSLDAMAVPPPDAGWLPPRTLGHGLVYAAWRSLLVAPGLLVLAPVLLRRASARVGLAVLAVAGLFPALVAVLIARDASWGNLRYFVPLVPLMAVSVLWLAARTSRTSGRAALAGLLVLGVVSATVAGADPRLTAVESEWQVFQAGLGRVASRELGYVSRWRSTADVVDERLRGAEPSGLVAIEMGKSFPLFLLTQYPARVMIDSDPRFEVLAAAGFDGVPFVFSVGEPTGTLRSGLGERPEQSWEKVELDSGTLYVRRDPTS